MIGRAVPSPAHCPPVARDLSLSVERPMSFGHRMVDSRRPTGSCAASTPRQRWCGSCLASPPSSSRAPSPRRHRPTRTPTLTGPSQASPLPLAGTASSCRASGSTGAKLRLGCAEESKIRAAQARAGPQATTRRREGRAARGGVVSKGWSVPTIAPRIGAPPRLDSTLTRGRTPRGTDREGPTGRATGVTRRHLMALRLGLIVADGVSAALVFPYASIAREALC